AQRDLGLARSGHEEADDKETDRREQRLAKDKVATIAGELQAAISRFGWYVWVAIIGFVLIIIALVYFWSAADNYCLTMLGGYVAQAAVDRKRTADLY